ncbi:hypothetical protein SSBR45G_19490 [Bradyrhizobium sp. SSBR45G]|uniref:hypothetical protein n=1 Tax=unclassified Bradyrhizobium TaxID=2631580 RepID=UPI0023429BE7|nr:MULTISPECIES: hypothetical protein [unclassified Bradyrhizobium]GLH77041.1 hypothetical protein SSBR45G_19490 [Bradyrhizobium sp. SSBR45G]GLH83799.1 hypothetical protein SSBR45R_12590 [Bradyrhizobium sp. SSBR45R]
MTEFLDKWVLKPELISGWLQALAAIIALGVSTWAVFWTTAASRRRDRLESRGLAVAVFPEILMLKAIIQQIRDSITDLKARYGNLVGQSIAAELQNRTAISIPPMLERNIDKLFLLGDLAGPSCLHLVRLIMQYNDIVARMAVLVATMNAEQWGGALVQLQAHLQLLDQIIANCEHEVQKIHDAIKG